MNGTDPYDPVPDLARLLSSALRQAYLGEPVPGVAVRAQTLVDALRLPELATAAEAEEAIRAVLAQARTTTTEGGAMSEQERIQQAVTEAEQAMADGTPMVTLDDLVPPETAPGGNQ